jgi:hypothetical protein
MKKTLVLAAIALLSITVAFAADISGKWTGQMPVRGGELADATFVFKVDGEKLTGTLNGIRGEQPIADGKIIGDSFSFIVKGADRGDQTFKGAIAGDVINMTRTGRRGEPRPFTIKRAN